MVAVQVSVGKKKKTIKNINGYSIFTFVISLLPWKLNF